ncbi:MAG: M60 family metallopeptidase [Pontiellaceae bacterium]|nr:M60 family metallopeptidase [Pontiellaceae bacterium]
MTPDDFWKYYERIKSGETNETLLRKCYAAFDRLLWKQVRLDDEIPPIPPALAAKIPQEILGANQVEVGPDRPFNTFEDPFVTLRLMLDCRMAASVPVDELLKHPSADGYPGKIEQGAKRLTETLQIDFGGYQDMISTGLFAPAGESVTITVPEGFADKGCVLQIGSLKQKTQVYKFRELHRAPYIVRRYPVDRPMITVVSAFGGLIYLRPKLPGNIDVQKNEYINPDGTFWTDSPVPFEKHIVPVTIAGAVQAPFYLHGVHTKDEWRKTISRYPAPEGEFGSDRFIYTMRTSQLRQIPDLDEVIELHNDMYDFMGDLTGRPNPPPHTFRAIVEQDLNVGFLYAGQPITMNNQWLDYLRNKKVSFGVAHETGHMHQMRVWTYQNGGEITVNIMACYVFEKIGEKWGDDAVSDNQERISDEWIKTSTDFWTSRPPNERSWLLATDREKTRPLLAFYSNLWKEFGWDAFKHVYRKYRTIPMDQWPGGYNKSARRGGGAETADEIERQRAGLFLELFSEEVGKNLSPYFDLWGQEVTEASRARVEHLPKWNLKGYEAMDVK